MQTTSCEICQKETASRFCPRCESEITRIVQKMMNGRAFKSTSMIKLLACKQVVGE